MEWQGRHRQSLDHRTIVEKERVLEMMMVKPSMRSMRGKRMRMDVWGREMRKGAGERSIRARFARLVVVERVGCTGGRKADKQQW